MVSYLTEPAAHQVCEESASALLRLPRLRRRHRQMADIGRSDARGAPTGRDSRRRAPVGREPTCGDRRRATETACPCGSTAPFRRACSERVSPGTLWPADGQSTPASPRSRSRARTARSDGFFLAVQTGAWAVGLPPAPHGDNERCTADGQARAVIALWAAASAVPDGGATLRDVIAEGSVGSVDRVRGLGRPSDVGSRLRRRRRATCPCAARPTGAPRCRRCSAATGIVGSTRQTSSADLAQRVRHRTRRHGTVASSTVSVIDSATYRHQPAARSGLSRADGPCRPLATVDAGDEWPGWRW